MSHSTEHIRTAVIELLNGTTSSIRQMTAATFAFGVFEGQPDGAQRALIADTATGAHRFDVEVGRVSNHESSSPSFASTRRLVAVRVSIPVWTKVSTTIEQSDRRSRLASIRDDCDAAMQALAYPGNLRQTSGADDTNIASGCLTGLTWRLERQLWDRGYIVSRIEGQALLRQTVLTHAETFDADWLVNSINGIADSQLIHGYLAEDSDTYRTIGAGGVSALHDFVGGNDFQQDIASRQPAMDATGAPGGRGRITFNDTASQFLQHAAWFTISTGDRLGVLSVEQHVSTKAVTNSRRFANGSNERIIGQRISGVGFTTGFRLNNTWDLVVQGAVDTNAHLFEAYSANPHSVWMDGAVNTSSGTGGLDGGVLQPWTIGGSSVGYGHMDMHMSLFMIFRLSGSSLPSYLPRLRSVINLYYGNEWNL